MKTALPTDPAQAVGHGHLRALCLAAEATPAPKLRQQADPHPVPEQAPLSRRQRDQSSEYYVYLLVSEHACVFKLGHTRRLAERVKVLRGQHGAFLAADSYLIKVASKRLARWIETQLKTYFNNPEWRAKAPCPYPKRPFNDVGGKHEWYHLFVFTSMQATLLSLLQRDWHPQHPLYDPGAPFALPSGMNLGEALGQAAGPTAPSVQPQLQTTADETTRRPTAKEATAWLEYSEANFRQVQAWVRQYWIWEVSLSPVVVGPDGLRRRTLCFSQLSRDMHPPELGPDPAPQVPPRGWHELCAFTHLRLRTREGELVERRYCEPVPASASGGTLAVTFVLDGLFGLKPTPFDPPTDLPQRIWRWLIQLGRPG